MTHDEQGEPGAPSVAEQYLAALEAVQRDLRAVLRTHAATAGWPLAVHALIETTGALAADVIHLDPTARAALVARLGVLHDQLMLALAPVGRGH